MENKDTYGRGGPPKQLMFKTEMVAGMKLGIALV